MTAKKQNKKVNSKLSKKKFEEGLRNKLKKQGINEEWMKSHLIID